MLPSSEALSKVKIDPQESNNDDDHVKTAIIFLQDLDRTMCSVNIEDLDPVYKTMLGMGS